MTTARARDGADQPKAAPADGASQANYVVAAVGTTVLYRAPHAAFAGPQGDASLGFGYGRFVTDSLTLELDASVTFVNGAGTSVALAPGALCLVSKNVFAGARAVVTVAPTVNVALAAGLGGLLSVSGSLAGFAEVDLVSSVVSGHPDLGLATTAGAFYSF